MNVLLVHNFYQQGGGEDQVFHAEHAALRDAGGRVWTYTVSNDSIGGAGGLSAAARAVWNRDAAREVGALVKRHAIDVVHFHNTFPLVSPASYYAARANGAAVVQTLHNYRLLCLNALFYRDGHVCEDCLGKAVPWPGVKHACYRDSRAASGATAAMLSVHRALGTYAREVDAFVTLTDFARGRMLAGGLPADRLVVKPNFLASDPGMSTGDGDFALFVGRLTPEKGVRTLLEAWKTLGSSVPLVIVGDGPLAGEVEAATRLLPNVRFLGRRDRADVLALMQRARMLVLPSLWYEGFPMTAVEAFAVGLPVVASDIGSLSSVVREDRTGALFQPGAAAELAKVVTRLASDDGTLARLRTGAREAFLAHYTVERHLQQIATIYEDAARRRADRSLARTGAFETDGRAG
ncbi:glycosyltransferase family 4 protein [Deinococcus yavapaiensis]|uniref:glycosyltransferase family 4 protein n=1 Tax=Deinococcus yavapaiensis TaxID=309889 RepID=UPI000DA268CA|nr:glycosyltransferase family 4 protein [Deinococcus yavapaiensis]